MGERLDECRAKRLPCPALASRETPCLDVFDSAPKTSLLTTLHVLTGGQLRYLHISKPATAPKCGDCHIALPGIKALRPREYAQVSKRLKTVQRAYGGSRCSNCVRER